MIRWPPVLVLALLAASAGAETPASAPLTLASAIAEALSKSPRMAAARAGVQSARAQYRQARAEGLPSLDLSVGARLQGPEARIAIPTSPGQPGDGPQLPARGLLNPRYAVEPQVAATVPLYTGGRVRAGKRAARAAERAALYREVDAGQALALDVAQAYLATAEARERLALVVAARELHRERLQVAQVRRRAGAAAPFEVSQAEAELAAAVQGEIEARARVGQEGATLNTLLGRPAAAPLVLVSLPASRPDEPLLPTRAAPLTAEELQALGLQRAALQAVQEEVRQREAQVEQARAAGRPQISLSGAFLRRIPETLLGGYAWSLGASLVQSLFDGGRSRAQTDGVRAGLAQAQAELGQAERQTAERVERARLALEEAEERLGAEEERVEAARDGVQVARTRVGAGDAAPVRLTEALTTLTQAETNALAARFALARARVNLAYLVGIARPETVPDLTAPVAVPAQSSEGGR